MEFLGRLVRSFKSTGPARVPSDTVIPLYDHDDQFAHRNVAFEYTMQFDEVLDADKLADALWRLIDRPGWRKLGARLRMNVTGKLEYHVPAEFSKERPPIGFTKAQYEMSVSEHPVLGSLPRPNGKLESFKVKDPLREALQLRGHSKVLADWISADVPQLGLHVCTFTDGTFVTLIWLHTLFDGMGRRDLLKAWRAVLEGREDDVPEFYAYDFDPLERLGASPDKAAAAPSQSPKIEKSVLEASQVRGLSFFKFAFHWIWESAWHPREHGRMICMPASYLASLRARAFKDLEPLDPSLITTNSSTGKPFLSDGDILCAWLIRLLARSNPYHLTPSGGARMQNVMNICGMRDILSYPSDGFAALLPKDKVYIANCATAIVSLFPMRDFITLPLGHIAAQIRHDLVLQGARAQLEASERLKRAEGSPLSGTSDMQLSAFTNWTKGRFFDAEFSAAIIKEAGRVKKEGARGKPIYIHPGSNVGNVPLRGSGNCIGQDAEGNWWLGGFLREEFCDNIDRLVGEMRREEYGHD